MSVPIIAWWQQRYKKKFWQPDWILCICGNIERLDNQNCQIFDRVTYFYKAPRYAYLVQYLNNSNQIPGIFYVAGITILWM